MDVQPFLLYNFVLWNVYVFLLVFSSPIFFLTEVFSRERFSRECAGHTL